jgi:RNA polymerase primary sigma factor
MYLREIARVPLLTTAQEVDLAMRIEGGVLAAELLASIAASGTIDEKRRRRIVRSVNATRNHELNTSNGLSLSPIGREGSSRTKPPKSLAGTVAFLNRIEDDSLRARKHLIEANLRLVVSIAKRYVGRGMLFLDLVQEGNLGLMRAADKFDHSKGYKFSTYATWWIRQGITRGIADQARTIRLPVHIGELNEARLRAQRGLVQGLGREPLTEEVGRQMGISTGAVVEIRRAAMGTVSLESAINPREDSPLQDFIEDKQAVVPVDSAVNASLRTDMSVALEVLSGRERRIVELRFGLIDGRPRTLEEVGVEFHLTRERIRQIESKAFSKLRHPSRMHALHDFLE